MFGALNSNVQAVVNWHWFNTTTIITEVKCYHKHLSINSKKLETLGIRFSLLLSLYPTMTTFIEFHMQCPFTGRTKNFSQIRFFMNFNYYREASYYVYTTHTLHEFYFVNETFSWKHFFPPPSVYGFFFSNQISSQNYWIAWLRKCSN